MINYKEVAMLLIVGILAVYGVRKLVIDASVRSMYFGCQEASLKEYRFFSVEDGNKLEKFCDARHKAVKNEWE